MMETIIKMNVDNRTTGFTDSKLCVKISSKENNGLSIVNGVITATKAPDGSSSESENMNTSGNGIGPINVDASTPLSTVGFNSTVSRHKKYTGDDQWLKDNDGPVMTKVSGSSLVANSSIASYMIAYANGG